jgi:hypothetical protein
MKNTNRVEGLHVKLSPSERSALEKLAEVEGRTISETAREVFRSACAQRGLFPGGKQTEVKHAI